MTDYFSKEVWALLGASTAIGIPLIINTTKEILFERNKRKKENDYICVQLIFLLDKFTVSCADAARDNGFAPDEPESGSRSQQVPPPIFSLETVKGEHKYLSPELLYKLHSIEIKLLIIKEELRVEALFADGELPFFFEKRQRLYGEIGLFACEIINKLCGQHQINHTTWSDKNSPESSIKKHILEINNTQSHREINKKYRYSKSILKD